jgi:hypothetical protein
VKGDGRCASASQQLRCGHRAEEEDDVRMLHVPQDAQLVCEAFARSLEDAGAVPCLAVHARMPPVDEQAEVFRLTQPAASQPLVARWNLHAGRGYEDAKADYFPFNRLMEEDLPSRTALARLARAAAAADRDVFITVNNKAEGSAPLSVQRLAEQIMT